MTWRKHLLVQELARKQTIGKKGHCTIERQVLPPTAGTLKGDEECRWMPCPTPVLKFLSLALGILALVVKFFVRLQESVWHQIQHRQV